MWPRWHCQHSVLCTFISRQKLKTALRQQFSPLSSSFTPRNQQKEKHDHSRKENERSKNEKDTQEPPTSVRQRLVAFGTTSASSLGADASDGKEEEVSTVTDALFVSSCTEHLSEVASPWQRILFGEVRCAESHTLEVALSASFNHCLRRTAFPNNRRHFVSCGTWSRQGPDLPVSTHVVGGHRL